MVTCTLFLFVLYLVFRFPNLFFIFEGSKNWFVCVYLVWERQKSETFYRTEVYHLSGTRTHSLFSPPPQVLWFAVLCVMCPVISRKRRCKVQHTIWLWTLNDLPQLVLVEHNRTISPMFNQYTFSTIVVLKAWSFWLVRYHCTPLIYVR